MDIKKFSRTFLDVKCRHVQGTKEKVFILKVFTGSGSGPICALFPAKEEVVLFASLSEALTGTD